MRFFSAASRLDSPPGIALADKHHAGPADHAVHDVHVPVARHRRGDRPVAAKRLQHRRRGARLSLDLRELGGLREPAEQDHGGEQAEQDAERNEECGEPGQQASDGEYRDDADGDKRDDRQGPWIGLPDDLRDHPDLRDPAWLFDVACGALTCAGISGLLGHGRQDTRPRRQDETASA